TAVHKEQCSRTNAKSSLTFNHASRLVDLTPVSTQSCARLCQMKLLLRKVIGALMAAFILGFAAEGSNVDTYSAFKVARYSQEGPRPGSLVRTSYAFGARVFANSGKLLTNASFTPPVGAIRLFERSGPLSLDYYGDGFYNSKSELDSAFPAGVYMFRAA